MKRTLLSATALLLCAAVRAQAPLSPSPPHTPLLLMQPTPQPSAQQPAAASPGQQPAPGTQQAPAYPSDQNATVPGGPVPLSAEPHHRLVLQNDFVHVYNVSVPPLDATLLHQHDLPYLYVTLDASEITNAVVGQPVVHMKLQEGDTGYNPGHFVHLIRTDSGLAFHNITIELPRAQGTARNLCKDVLPGQPTDCPHESAATPATKKPSAEAADDIVPYFETDEVRVDLRKVSSGRDYVEAAPKMNALLVSLTNANLDANLGGEHIQFLHGGDVLWLPAGVHRRVVDFLGTHSNFLLISFKDSATPPASP